MQNDPGGRRCSSFLPMRGGDPRGCLRGLQTRFERQEWDVLGLIAGIIDRTGPQRGGDVLPPPFELTFEVFDGRCGFKVADS